MESLVLFYISVCVFIHSTNISWLSREFLAHHRKSRSVHAAPAITNNRDFECTQDLEGKRFLQNNGTTILFFKLIKNFPHDDKVIKTPCKKQ